MRGLSYHWLKVAELVKGHFVFSRSSWFSVLARSHDIPPGLIAASGVLREHTHTEDDEPRAPQNS